MENNKIYRYKTPTKDIVKAVLMSVLGVAIVIGGIVLLNDRMANARKRGVIVEKRFEPFEHREQRIEIGKEGFRQTISDGKYIIMVEVPPPWPQRWFGLGESRLIHVSFPDDQAERFEQLKLGDKFDVGPYLVN